MIGSCFQGYPALLIPALPFGLGWRFDQTPSGNALTRLPEYRANPAGQAKMVSFCSRSSAGGKGPKTFLNRAISRERCRSNCRVTLSYR